MCISWGSLWTARSSCVLSRSSPCPSPFPVLLHSGCSIGSLEGLWCLFPPHPHHPSVLSSFVSAKAWAEAVAWGIYPKHNTLTPHLKEKVTVSMLPLLLHKHWFSNLICYLAASWPLTPPKTKRKKETTPNCRWANPLITHCLWLAGSGRLCARWDPGFSPVGCWLFPLKQASLQLLCPFVSCADGREAEQWAVGEHLCKHPIPSPSASRLKPVTGMNS